MMTFSKSTSFSINFFFSLSNNLPPPKQTILKLSYISLQILKALINLKKFLYLFLLPINKKNLKSNFCLLLNEV